MTTVQMKFRLTFNIDSTEDIDSFGKQLAIFLQETFNNGEDVFIVDYLETDY